MGKESAFGPETGLGERKLGFGLSVLVFGLVMWPGVDLGK